VVAVLSELFSRFVGPFVTLSASVRATPKATLARRSHENCKYVRNVSGHAILFFRNGTFTNFRSETELLPKAFVSQSCRTQRSILIHLRRDSRKYNCYSCGETIENTITIRAERQLQITIRALERQLQIQFAERQLQILFTIRAERQLQMQFAIREERQLQNNTIAFRASCKINTIAIRVETIANTITERQQNCH
jgi:hypothetical protein